MDTCNKKEKQNSNESTSQKGAGYSQQYVNDCQKFNKLIERNIRTLRRISYKDKLEELYQGFEDEGQLKHLDFYNFSFSEYMGIAKLLTFWDEYIPNSIICSRSKPLQKRNFITGFIDFSTLKPKSELKMRAKRINTFKINNMTILRDFLEKQIGEICCNVVFNLHQILQAMDEENLSMLPDDPIIPKQIVESIHANNKNAATKSQLPMEYFYRDHIQVYYWDSLFGEIAEKIGGTLYNTLSQCYKLDNPCHAHYIIKNGIFNSFKLLTLSEQSVKEKIWLGKNGYDSYGEINYAICYTVCTYRNSNDTNKLIPILLDGITSDTLQHFNPLWNKLKRYVEYKDRLRVNVESLNKNTVFQDLKTLDEATNYLRYVEGNESYSSIEEGSEDVTVPDKENNDNNIQQRKSVKLKTNEIPNLSSTRQDSAQVNNIDEKEEIVTSTVTFGLNLDQKNVEYLFDEMNENYFRKTSLKQFTYVLTGRGEPEHTHQIEWIASSRSFAVFIGIVCHNCNKKWIMGRKYFTGEFNKNLSDDYSSFANKLGTSSEPIPKGFASKSAYINETDESLKQLIVILKDFKIANQ